MNVVAAIIAALRTIAALLGLVQSEKERQAGRDEVLARDAAEEADAARKGAAIVMKGQTNAQTKADLSSGDF